MKASEIIDKLQQLTEEHGDLRVLVNSDGHYNMSTDYVSILYENDDGDCLDTHYDNDVDFIQNATRKCILIAGH